MTLTQSQAKQEKTMAMMIAIVNIIVVALFSQSLFVVHRMLKAQQRTYVVFSQAIMEIVLAKYPNVDRDTMAAKILNYAKVKNKNHHRPRHERHETCRKEREIRAKPNPHARTLILPP